MNASRREPASRRPEPPEAALGEVERVRRRLFELTGKTVEPSQTLPGAARVRDDEANLEDQPPLHFEQDGERAQAQSVDSSDFASPRSQKRRSKKTQDKDATDTTERLSPDALREAALNYLNRYDGSVEQVRRVLRRRIKKLTNEVLSHENTIEQVLTDLTRARLLDDTRFAENLTQSLRSRGASALKIRTKLRQRGVVTNAIDAARLSEEDPALSELEAAKTYVAKKRLRQRFDLTDPTARNKALGALARQGFSYEVAHRALSNNPDKGEY